MGGGGVGSDVRFSKANAVVLALHDYESDFTSRAYYELLAVVLALRDSGICVVRTLV